MQSNNYNSQITMIVNDILYLLCKVAKIYCMILLNNYNCTIIL